jgi:hypothetical protein
MRAIKSILATVALATSASVYADTMTLACRIANDTLHPLYLVIDLSAETVRIGLDPSSPAFAADITNEEITFTRVGGGYVGEKTLYTVNRTSGALDEKLNIPGDSLSPHYSSFQCEKQTGKAF